MKLTLLLSIYMESVPLFLDDNGVVFYEPVLFCDEKSRSVNLMLRLFMV